MASDAADRIAVCGAVLYLEALRRVCVVTGPCLRRVIEHAGIKAPSPAGAGFKQDLGKFPGQPIIQIIDPQYITVEHLPLPVCRKGGWITLGNAPVHIPFYIWNPGFPQYFRHHLINSAYHLRTGIVQYILIPSVGTASARNMEDPVRMLPIKSGILIDHFRLKPQSELHTKVLDLFSHSLTPPFCIYKIAFPVLL